MKDIKADKFVERQQTPSGAGFEMRDNMDSARRDVSEKTITDRKGIYRGIAPRQQVQKRKRQIAESVARIHNDTYSQTRENMIKRGNRVRHRWGYGMRKNHR